MPRCIVVIFLCTIIFSGCDNKNKIKNNNAGKIEDTCNSARDILSECALQAINTINDCNALVPEGLENSFCFEKARRSRSKICRAFELYFSKQCQ